MFAKKNVLAAAIMLFNDEILDEDEMFCVFSELNRKNPPFPYWNYDRGGRKGGTNTAIPHVVAREYRNTASKFSQIPKPQLQMGKS